MTQAEDSSIPELEAFVVKLCQDVEAVAAAMVLCPTVRDRLRAG
jgi:hypothetical protein